ncbi:MAG TPA: hypothetical protein VFO54_01910 [Chryseosolibacter sp.]|nr:hypothetical protein [Chryseosolibacter sp.]
MIFYRLWFFFLFITSTVLSQSFEGKILYQNTYKSKSPNVTDEQISQMLGTEQEYLIKEGNYKSSSNGTFLLWSLYISKDNKLYAKMANSPAIFWRDGAENPDEVTKAEINKGVVTILGHLCDELVLTCKSGIQKYYFSPKVKADPAVFSQHKFGNWSEFISRSKALPLKILIETPQFIMESIATEIAAAKLDDAEFELPADSQLQKSPY